MGSVAAERLAISDVAAGPRLYISGRWLTVAGILDEFPLAPTIDRSALIGYPIAGEILGAITTKSSARLGRGERCNDEDERVANDPASGRGRPRTLGRISAAHQARLPGPRTSQRARNVA